MNLRSISLLLLFICQFSVWGKAPSSRDLVETDKNQRRDLSVPLSRVVLNFFDFNQSLSAAAYSNRPSMPLNVAYLSTEKNEPGNKPLYRFSRSIPDLLTMHYTNDGVDSLMRDDQLGVASSFTTQWMPHVLPFSVDYTGGCKVNGFDFIYDTATVVRRMEIQDCETNFCFSGKYAGKIELINNVIVVYNNHIRYAITFSQPVIHFKLYDGKWYLQLAPQKNPLRELTIAVAFADKNEQKLDLMLRAMKPIKLNNIDKVLTQQEKYWDDLLKKIPEPASFDLTMIDARGVMSEDIRQAYYKAWVFTAQNILPNDPDCYPYPQIATGKASLWDEGEERAPFSAAWESFIGMQLYAYLDPELAWQAFKGMMTLVDEKGMLGGESLPSRKAQTALVLYELTNDKPSLQEVYPALTRYLNWRMEITHWVYGDMKATKTIKDAEFAFSALSDMQYMIQIAERLNYSTDVVYWKGKVDEFGRKSLSWFWKTPQSLPQQGYHTDTKQRSDGNTIWTTTCLHVKDYLKHDYLTSTIARFDQDYNTDAAFAGFSIPKYPDVSYSVYGLLEHGMHERALGTMEACLRDIARGHAAFAEQYTLPDFLPDGVRPSLFGSSIIIDFVLLANGYMLGDGMPQAVLFPAKLGGVSGLQIKGKVYDLLIDPKKNGVTWKQKKGSNWDIVKGDSLILKLNTL